MNPVDMGKSRRSSRLILLGAAPVALLAAIVWLAVPLPLLPDLSTVWGHFTAIGVGPTILGVAVVWSIVTY